MPRGPRASSLKLAPALLASLPASDNLAGSVWPGRCAGIAVAASVAPLLWAVLMHPINKGTVFVGPITLFTGISLVAWILTSMAGFAVALWTHFRRPLLRWRVWLTLLAGELFYTSGFMCIGAVVSRVLNGHWKSDLSSALILSVSVIGCAWSTRAALRRRERK